MKKNDKTQKQTYFEWFNENWTRAGGLITTSTAAKILNVKMPSITQKWKRDKLRKYVFKKQDGEELPLLGLRDVLLIKEWRDKGIDIKGIDYEWEEKREAEEEYFGSFCIFVPFQATL